MLYERSSCTRPALVTLSSRARHALVMLSARSSHFPSARLTGKTNPLKIVGMHKEVETKRLKAAAKMLTDAPVPRSPGSPITAPCDANAPLELAVKDKESCQ
jgi:hypothetical protein